MSLSAVPPSRGVDTHTSRNATQRPQIRSFGHWAFMSITHKHPCTQPMDPEDIQIAALVGGKVLCLGVQLRPIDDNVKVF